MASTTRFANTPTRTIGTGACRSIRHLPHLCRCRQSEASPVHQLFSLVQSYTQYFFSFFLPLESRSGRVIVPVIGVAVTLLVILLALFPILYITAYLLGKFVLAPLVLAPFQSRVKAGRSLDDPVLLDTLTEGVMKALETYNMLQDLNTMRSG